MDREREEPVSSDDSLLELSQAGGSLPQDKEEVPKDEVKKFEKPTDFLRSEQESFKKLSTVSEGNNRLLKAIGVAAEYTLAKRVLAERFKSAGKEELESAKEAIQDFTNSLGRAEDALEKYNPSDTHYTGESQMIYAKQGLRSQIDTVIAWYRLEIDKEKKAIADAEKEIKLEADKEKQAIAAAEEEIKKEDKEIAHLESLVSPHDQKLTLGKWRKCAYDDLGIINHWAMHYDEDNAKDLWEDQNMSFSPDELLDGSAQKRITEALANAQKEEPKTPGIKGIAERTLGFGREKRTENYKARRAKTAVLEAFLVNIGELKKRCDSVGTTLIKRKANRATIEENLAKHRAALEKLEIGEDLAKHRKALETLESIESGKM